MNNPVLNSILEPLAVHYNPCDVIEVRMSAPHKVVIETRGVGKQCIDDKALNLATLERISANLANNNGLAFDANTSPNVSCTLPDGHRFESLVGSSVQSGLSLSIRCKHPFNATYEDYGLAESSATFIKEAIISGQHIIVSGGTNTGKTTLLNLMLKSLDASTRLVVLEDTPEVQFDHFWDSVGLIASRTGASPSMLPWSGLYDHSNRITPDRLIFSEISTNNAEAALALMNSGGSGFMCTIHAENSQQVMERRFDQILSLAGKQMNNLPDLLRETVDVIIQIQRGDGFRYVSEIYLPKENRHIFKRKK